MSEAQVPDVMLSGKEISGLAGRVVGTALMPFGARGGAADTVEFLELCDGSGLALLESEMERLSVDMWRTPQINSELQDAALADAAGGSALYFSAPLADWTIAMVREHGAAFIGLRGASHRHYLHALPFWLATRGYTSCVLTVGQTSEIQFSMASGDDNSWWYCKRSGIPGGLAAIVNAVCQASPDPHLLEAARISAARWLAGHAGADAFFTTTDSPMQLPESLSLVVASRTRIAQPPQGALTSAEFSRRKHVCLADGWPIARGRWANLMRFGDLSLVPTSEESRAGAG